MLNSESDAFALLKDMGASEHLIKHVQLVGEAATLILHKCGQFHTRIDSEFIKIGVVIHDAGKIIRTDEMSGPGSYHEEEGEKLLIERGVSPQTARCCVSHSRWRKMECSLEELIIALADKLWKGKRVDALELQVIDHIAKASGKDRWEIFSELDAHFESIAADGDDRLNRSTCS